MLLVGPLIFFSDVGGFIAPNPVLSGDIQYSFVITKLVSESDLETTTPKHYQAAEDSGSLAGWSESQTELVFDPADATTLAAADQDGERSDTKNIKQRMPYGFFANKNPFFRTFDKAYQEASVFNKWTETRFLDADQLQDCLVSEYSDTVWLISARQKDYLWADLGKAMDLANPYFHFELGLSYKFTRKLPETARTASRRFFRKLDFSFAEDCKTRQQLLALANFNCSDPDPAAPRHTSIRFS